MINSELLKIVDAALAESDKTKFEAEAKDIASLVGKWVGKKYIIKDEFDTSTSCTLRYPSYAWPHSHFKHVLTRKYLKALREECLPE